MGEKKDATFPDAIVLRDAGMRGGSRLFKLAARFRVMTSKGQITIPLGFETDGASVPRIFWNILQPLGSYFPAALLHDYLYSRDSDKCIFVTRAKADSLFLEAMYNLGVPWWTRNTIYSAVRLGGWACYKKK